ncbi:hypothetical protein PENANT_c017G00514 [Penicillium antarcticum]|uniref:Uncharacterized protein n=1 Tax=Penicillium antarcticum TaxID=416450 RepID=A0A1V6Q2W8_9EURO|nr:hypothetical protein PENANT_c017G00514 [Penicillium antarcticum]
MSNNNMIYGNFPIIRLLLSGRQKPQSNGSMPGFYGISLKASGTPRRFALAQAASTVFFATKGLLKRHVDTQHVSPGSLFVLNVANGSTVEATGLTIWEMFMAYTHREDVELAVYFKLGVWRNRVLMEPEPCLAFVVRWKAPRVVLLTSHASGIAHLNMFSVFDEIICCKLYLIQTKAHERILAGKATHW